MNDRIPFAFPFIGKEEEEGVLRVLRSGWLTTGAETLAFEAEFASFFSHGPSREVPYALAVNSATSGLHLALEACGVGPTDVIITTPYTFTSTAEVARYLGAEVAFVDCAPQSFNMDPQKLEAVIERLQSGLCAYESRSGISGTGFGPRGRPAAIVPVHFAGLPCDMDAIASIARRYDLPVIEDAAHAFPSRLADGSYAGDLSDIGVFSFYATKTITTGEGGMILTRKEDLAKRIAMMRSHGIDRTVWNRYTDQKASWQYEVVEAGYKYNMPDLLAVIGRAQLARASHLLVLRHTIAQKYDGAFSKDERLLVPPTAVSDARHLYPLRLAGKFGKDRDRLIERLQGMGIGVSVHFIPLHTMPYYAKLYGLRKEDFPNALDSYLRTLSLPIWPGMTNSQVERVIETLFICLEKE